MDSPEGSDRLLLLTQGMAQLAGRALVPGLITFLPAMWTAIEKPS